MKSRLLLLAAATAASAQAPTTLQQINALLTANGLKADVSFLASDLLEGRGTPSRGLDLAAEYIASEFRRAGLEPVGDDGYFQTANFATVAPNTDGLEFTLEFGGKTYKVDKAAATIQDAVAADLKSLPAVVVAMDAPTALDSVTPAQAAGKALVLVYPDAAAGAGRAGGGGRGGAPSLQRLKPAVVVTVRGAAATNGRGARGGRGPALRDASTLSSVPSLTLNDAALRDALASKPTDATVSLHMAAPAITQVKLRNVIGVLRGVDPALKDTYMLVTAHYDHLGIRDTGGADRIFNGADDDASGTASVIEIAKTLSALPAKPKRSIVFMTQFGEELGDLGSRYYAEHPVFPLAKTIADVNLEQLGRTDDTEGPRVGAFNLTGFDYSDIFEYFRKAEKQTDVRAIKHEKNSDSYFGRSDNAAFANAGVPSTTLSVAYDFPDYHGAGDEWQKLDYDNMAKVDRAIALAALDMANSAQEPKWDANNPKVERYIKAREATMAAAKGK